jgi:hypothetical protein
MKGRLRNRRRIFLVMAKGCNGIFENYICQRHKNGIPHPYAVLPIGFWGLLLQKTC